MSSVDISTSAPCLTSACGRRGAAALHHDRGQPGIQRPVLEQLVEHARPQPWVEIIDVRLQLQGGGGGVVRIGGGADGGDRVDRSAHQHPHHVGPTGGVLGAGADAEGLGEQRGLRARRARQTSQQGHAGGGGELADPGRDTGGDLPAAVLVGAALGVGGQVVLVGMAVVVGVRVAVGAAAGGQQLAGDRRPAQEPGATARDAAPGCRRARHGSGPSRRRARCRSPR